jgi:hypothetical protein
MRNDEGCEWPMEIDGDTMADALSVIICIKTSNKKTSIE